MADATFNLKIDTMANRTTLQRVNRQMSDLARTVARGFVTRVGQRGMDEDFSNSHNHEGSPAGCVALS